MNSAAAFIPAIIVLALLAWLIARLFRSPSKLVCTACGTVAKPKMVTRGSILIEIVLWLCFIIPGLIYSIWRHTTRGNACAACGSEQLVPVESPVGRKLIAKHMPKLKP